MTKTFNAKEFGRDMEELCDKHLSETSISDDELRYIVTSSIDMLYQLLLHTACKGDTADTGSIMLAVMDVSKRYIETDNDETKH